MGKKGGAKVEVTEYFLSQHFGICMGEPDALKEIIIDEKTAWEGSQESEADLAINKGELFGGIKKEGGAIGTARFLPGAADQVLPDALAQRLGRASGAVTPGFRGLASLFFTGSTLGRGFYWRANSPFLPGVWAKLQRILKRADGSEQWYAAKAAINSCGAAEGTETRIRVEWLNASTSVPGNGYAITGSGVTRIDQGDDIPAANEATTLLTAYVVEYPFDRLEFVWKDPDGPLPETSINLRLQFQSGSVASDMRAKLSILQAGSASYQTLFPKSGSHSTADANGYFDVRSLWPDDWQFDIPGAEVSGDALDMNPAHIIHECLTDTIWGMGTPLAALDDDAFRAAADTLYDESFGLSMMWVRQSNIEDFIQEVLDHINAVLFTDPSTGLLTLALIRDDYVVDDLPTLTPDNADLTGFSRKLWGDIVNEIIVTWTNPENEQEETITVQDDASISIQGGIISDSRNYYAVRCAELAMRLAYRDLRSAGQPLASMKATVDRSQYALRPASVVKVTWPEYGLTDLVMRVTAVDYGKPGEPEIELDLVEDVFGLDIGSFDIPASSSWIDPAADPEAFDEELIFTLPLYFAIYSVVGDFTESPEYPEVVAGILTRSTNSDAYAYELWDEITLANGSTEWQRIAENNVLGSATLAAELPLEAETSGVSFENFSGQTSPEVGGFVLIGDGTEETDEIALVDADSGTFTLLRGVLDTVPRAWPEGTRVYFINDDTLYEDRLIRSGGELVDYRALMKTSRGTLDFDSAATFSHTLTDRPWLPNRPANVQALGIAFSSELSPIDGTDRADPWITVTWSIRNRLDEDSVILEWTDAGMTAEAGQTTTIEVRAADGTLLAMHDALSGESFNVPDASFGSEEIVRLRVYSERSDDSLILESLQYFEHWVRLDGVARQTEASIDRVTETGDTRLLEN